MKNLQKKASPAEKQNRQTIHKRSKTGQCQGIHCQEKQTELIGYCYLETPIIKNGIVKPSGEKEKLEYCLDCYLYNKPLMEARMEREQEKDPAFIPYKWFWFYDENATLQKQNNLAKVEGILTSSLQLKGTGTNNPYYLAFFQLEGVEKQDIPTIFKVDSSSEPTPPDLPPQAKVLLEGHWAEPNNSTRPSFTCLAWEIVSDPPPLTLKSLFQQISSLLSISLKKLVEWKQRTDYLFKKRKDLDQLDQLSKLGEEYLSAYLLLRKAHYSNYQNSLLSLNQFNQEEYLTKLAQEIEEAAQHIRAYEAVFKKNSSISDLPKVNTDYESKDPLKDLKRQNQDLDYLITSGKSELRKELRILQGKLRNCKCGANSEAI